MSTRQEILLAIFVPAGMLSLGYLYAQYLMLNAVFIRQLDAMHARLTQGQPLEGTELDPDPIPWQTALDGASIRPRRRIVQHHLVHPTYRYTVAAYKTLEGRLSIGMLLTVVALWVLMVLV